MRLLALDTATEWCSVAVWCNGELLQREVPAERGHGAQLLSLIDALLAEAGIGLGALDALAFGRGPGAFTGLRLAASVTQGLAFSAGLPVIPISDLRALAQQIATPADPDSRVLVCHDARMGEVYWAGFSVHGGHACADTPEYVAAPKSMLDRAREWIGRGSARGAGSGFAVYPDLSALSPLLIQVRSDIHPRAQEIAFLAAGDGLDHAVAPEQALPVYVRDNVAVVPGTRAPGP